MFVRKSTHDDLKEQYNALMAAHKMDLETITAQHQNFEVIVAAVQNTKNENVSLTLFIQDCLTWIEDAPLYLRGTKTPDLRKRREELRERAKKYEILMAEDGVTEDGQEKSA